MSAQTQAVLLALARQRFGEIGYAEVSLEELTAAAGMTRGALYHHFESKLGLFRAVVAGIEQQVDRDVAARVAAAGNAGEDPWERLRIASHCYLETVLQPDIRQIMLRDAPSFYPGFAERPTRLHCHALTVQMLAELYRARKTAIANAEGGAWMIEGAIAGIAGWAAQSCETDVAVAGRLLDQFLDSLGAAR